MTIDSTVTTTVWETGCKAMLSVILWDLLCNIAVVVFVSYVILRALAMKIKKQSAFLWQ